VLVLFHIYTLALAHLLLESFSGTLEGARLCCGEEEYLY
jgi:hypothetical protein